MRSNALFSLIVVLLLVLACANPAAALERPPVNTGSPSQASADDPKDAVAPVIGLVGYVVGDELIYFLLSAGVIAGIAATPKSVSMSDDLVAKIYEAWNLLQGLTDAVYRFLFGNATITVYKEGSDKYTSYINAIEKDYNGAKDDGVPARNHGKSDDNHKMPNTYNRYSSLYLFHDATDEANGCPKQLRYYGKDGNPDLDIDLYHGAKEKVGFPHTHTWSGTTRGEATTSFDNFIDSALWQKCKKYDYYNQKFRE